MHGVGVNNVLRSFRSHKNLKSERRIQHLQDGERYQIRPSEASSIETLNSDTSFSPSRPSTSSRTGGSIDINPLRLHPPTEDLFVPPHGSLRSPPRHHYERAHLGSSGSTSSAESMGMEHPTPNFRQLQAQRTGSLEIYEGFDFGFDNNQTPGPRRNTTAGSGDDYFSRPVQPKSHWSPSPTPTPGTGEDEGEDMEDPDETPGPGPTPGPTEWSTPTRARGRPLEAVNSPEYFIKRGDWKRRGIVFTPKMPMASEDETFDLED
ncbi:hypothetical protein NKR19_g6096 [Coniochaeta hoffmannii]|uniref:Uncharacterized protein n=1 Tax=Coniochaeta hoffmannii TaxID=91930 RepID=A0AA38VQV8_9PEZI|nr:hypothetical protein NKR19_g6096 [Coniochaeta hoffmannii]